VATVAQGGDWQLRLWLTRGQTSMPTPGTNRTRAHWVPYRIQRALVQGELTLHLQPQVSMTTGRVEVVEALVRWRRPRGGLVFPDAFIEPVRRSHLARRFDAWVLGAAVTEAAALQEAGYPLRVAVNLAPSSLADPRLADDIGRLLEDGGVGADALEIEVTEQVLEAARQAEATLVALADLGVATALDDFGVGFSSLTRLAALPFNTLKIDRHLVAGIERGTRAATVFAAAVRLAHDLGLDVVVEGVETLRTWAHSAKLHAERAQGWLFAPALSRRDLLDWLAAGTLAGPASELAVPGWAPAGVAA
jgi:EAL domain-containing protein (putative c-di-GMP-specific phosphodiesterase class I)